MRSLAVALAAIACLLLPAGAAAAATKLKPVGNPHVSKVAVNSLTIAWKDRSRGERRYEVTASVRGADGADKRVLEAGAERVRLRKLVPGTVYAYSIRACRARSTCGPSRSGKPAATLLAPFGGPHPALNCSVFPAADAFNERVAGKPVAPNSDRIIDRLGGEIHPDFGSNPSYGIPYVVVPADQPGARIRFTAYGDESDAGPYPIPPGAPIEGGRNSDGDRHLLVVRRPAAAGGSCKLYELYRAFESGRGYRGDSGSIFDLGAALIGQRPAGWTSADAAGLPIFPGLVTYEEVASGEIDHAIRITFAETRKAYYPPATHYASSSCSQDLPAMGERLRLRSGYDISGFSGEAKVIATALKQYGAIVADNGSNWFISGSADRRWKDENLNQLKRIPGSAFEVVRPETKPSSPC